MSEQLHGGIVCPIGKQQFSLMAAGKQEYENHSVPVGGGC